MIISPNSITKISSYSLYKPNSSYFSLNEFKHKKDLTSGDEITLDYQGIYYYLSEMTREEKIENFKNKHPYIRKNTISPKESELKEKYKNTIKKDIFVQYDEFFKKQAPQSSCIKKGLINRGNYLVYGNKNGLDILLPSLHKTFPFLSFAFLSLPSESILCFDIKHNLSKNFISVLGTNYGRCEIFNVKNEHYENLIENNIMFKAPETIKVESILVNEENGEDEEFYVNYVEFGEDFLAVSGSDCLYREYDLEKMKKKREVNVNAPINHCSFNSSHTLLICAEESTSLELFDMRSYGKLSTFPGGFEYNLVVRFNQFNEYFIASGNQDSSCKIWDIRKPDKHLSEFWGICDGYCDLCWLGKDKVSAVENILYWSVFDFKNNTIQMNNFIGEGNSISFDSDTDSIYLNIIHEEYGGILHYKKIKSKVNSMNCLDL